MSKRIIWLQPGAFLLDERLEAHSNEGGFPGDPGNPPRFFEKLAVDVQGGPHMHALTPIMHIMQESPIAMKAAGSLRIPALDDPSLRP
jgi:hypothetical protein